MSIETIIDNLIAAIESRDAAAVGDLLAEDVSFENIPEGQAIYGRAAAQAQFADFFTKATKIKWIIERKIISGNTAIIERKNNIYFLGKKVLLPMVSVIEVENDQIKLFRDYFDLQTFIKQLAP